MNETTPPIMTINDELLDKLEQLAIGAKGWNMPIAFQEPEEGFLPEDWEWHVGTVDEDGIRYPLLHVNAHQYDSDDSEKLARYYAAVNRDTILALLQHVRELKEDAERYRLFAETVVAESSGAEMTPQQRKLFGCMNSVYSVTMDELAAMFDEARSSAD